MQETKQKEKQCCETKNEFMTHHIHHCPKCWHINTAHPTSKNYCDDEYCHCHIKSTNEVETKQKEIRDFSPRDIAIQIMKAVEVADISQWDGKNVFEEGEYEDIFNSIIDGISTLLSEDRAKTVEEIEKLKFILSDINSYEKDGEIDTLCKQGLDIISNLANRK